MTSSEARELIQAAIPEKKTAAWADLGCGSGNFTYAIASLLEAGSKIIAIDKLSQHMAAERNGVKIEFKQADLENQVLNYDQLDGILIANTLHYIKDQLAFLKRIKSWLADDGKLILVEYDTDQRNAWVPYPLTFERAEKLLTDAGFAEVSKIGAVDSNIRPETIFACMATS